MSAASSTSLTTATALSSITTSTPSRILWLMQRALSGSIHTRVWSIFWNRRQANALRLLVTGFRRLVKKRRRRRHAGDLGIQQPPRTAQRRDWFRSDADRRVESQRHQR